MIRALILMIVLSILGCERAPIETQTITPKDLIIGKWEQDYSSTPFDYVYQFGETDFIVTLSSDGKDGLRQFGGYTLIGENLTLRWDSLKNLYTGATEDLQILEIVKMVEITDHTMILKWGESSYMLYTRLEP